MSYRCWCGDEIQVGMGAAHVHRDERVQRIDPHARCREELAAALSREENLRGVHQETHAALAKAGPAIHDLANLDHARAVEALARERDAARAEVREWAEEVDLNARALKAALACGDGVATVLREEMRARVEALARVASLEKGERDAWGRARHYEEVAIASEAREAALRAKVEALADGIVEGAHVGLDAMKLRLRAFLASPPVAEPPGAAPTLWAYEAACKALEKWRGQARIAREWAERWKSCAFNFRCSFLEGRDKWRTERWELQKTIAALDVAAKIPTPPRETQVCLECGHNAWVQCEEHEGTHRKSAECVGAVTDLPPDGDAEGSTTVVPGAEGAR